jgi:hypothetical protein
MMESNTPSKEIEGGIFDVDPRGPCAECEPKKIRADGTVNIDWSWTRSTNKSCWDKFHFISLLGHSTTISLLTKIQRSASLHNIVTVQHCTCRNIKL